MERLIGPAVLLASIVTGFTIAVVLAPYVAVLVVFAMQGLCHV